VREERRGEERRGEERRGECQLMCVDLIYLRVVREIYVVVCE
jgi:hypothetical protein